MTMPSQSLNLSVDSLKATPLPPPKVPKGSHLTKSFLLARQQQLLAQLAAATGVVENHNAILTSTEGAEQVLGSLLLQIPEGTGYPLLNAMENSNKELRAVLNALNRLDQETYGFCINCEQPIPQKRLEAMPTTVRCVVCQQKAHP
ncbi:TraR/DksA C4-type zinc finger protein [Patescibacteria group bacterium]|nr:TraR/DksA C4-type zinc finger protein [Patescibacteria group bacterium]